MLRYIGLVGAIGSIELGVNTNLQVFLRQVEEQNRRLPVFALRAQW
jgi:hypothetical protein